MTFSTGFPISLFNLSKTLSYSCLEHFLQEEPNICVQDLYDKTVEQWLLNDLGEIGLGCLPDSVCTDAGIQMLNERYHLQMQYVLDIG